MQGMNWAAATIATTEWPDGLNASQTYGQQYTVGQTIGAAVLKAGGATVRMPIDTYLTTGNNWYLYAGAINGVCSTGCKVILCYWLPSGSSAVTNVNTWYAIWDTVNNSFGVSDTYLRYEPVNEPVYSNVADLINLYAGFVSRYNPPAWKCIFDGNNVATDCVSLGNDSRLNNQYLGLHMYSWFASEPSPGGGASWQGYYNKCASCVGSYAWRTVITETGVQTDGRSPSVPFWQQWDFSMAPDQAALSGTLAWARDNNVASVAYSGINNGDLYHWFYSNTNLTEVNTQVCDMFRWSWHKAVSSPLATVGQHKLQNRADSLFLDNLGSLVSGAGVAQWASSSSNNQVWNLTQESSVWYRLENVTSSDFLDGMGYTTNGSSVCQWPGSGSWNQRWALEPTDSGYYKLINESTGLCVDTDGQTSNGATMQQWGTGSSYNQQWAFK